MASRPRGSRWSNARVRATSTTCLIARAFAVWARSNTRAYVREQYPDAEVHIYYIDIRAHDKLEAFYDRVRADPQVKFIKSKPAHIRVGEDGRPMLFGERTIEREIYAEPYDLVVLATGMQPSAVDGYRPTLGLAADEYGFLVPREGDGEGVSRRRRLRPARRFDVGAVGDGRRAESHSGGQDA